MGDFFALKALYKEHHTKVYRTALCILRDPFLAKEVAQETFLRIQRNADCYSPVIGETAFVIAVARSLCFDIQKKRASLIPEYEDLKIAQISSTPGFTNEFMDFLSPLCETEQEVLCLRFLCGLDDKESGIILNKTPRMIKRLYRKALTELSEAYKKKGGGSDAAIEGL